MEVKTVNFSIRAEVEINKSVGCVWENLMEFSKLAPMVDKTELVEGDWDKVGRKLLITKKNKGMRPYYLELIKLVPFKQTVQKTYTKDGNQHNGFLDISLTESESEKTVVLYNSYCTNVYPVGEYDETKTQDYLNGKEMENLIMDGFLVPLKEYVESRS